MKIIPTFKNLRSVVQLTNNQLKIYIYNGSKYYER